jgi:hypothetical protein
LKKTEALWPVIEQAYALVHQAAHVLANHDNACGQAVREQYERVLTTIREQQASLGPRERSTQYLLEEDRELLACSTVMTSPICPERTMRFVHCFGSVRYGERRASGRRGAIAALVVRGPVRVLTALALQRQCFLPRALAFADLEAWYTMREHLSFRREARRKQLRFRKNPAAYLAALEEVLLKTGLPS